MNFFKNFIWNEVESSPFFTASWEPRYLKKLLVIFSIGISCFVSFTALFISSTISLPIHNEGTKYYIELNDFSSISQPYLVIISPPISKRLNISSNGVFLYKINGTKYTFGTLYKFSDIHPNIRIDFNTSKKITQAVVRVHIPIVKYASALIKIATFLVTAACLFLSYKSSSIRPFLSQYFLIFLYSLFNLPFFSFDTLIRSIITMTFWFGFISVSFLQVRILSSNIPTIFSSLFVLIGLCSFSTIMTYFNSNFFYISILLVVGLVAASIYLFYIGTAILSQFLLAVHFGWMWTIGLCIYFANILRNMSITFQTSFFVDVMNSVIVSVFIVFQSIYLIGEPVKAKIPEAPLDQAAKINRIDQLLEKLADKEENGSRKF
ncbi:hypothetical protein TVAG_129580 [Trichomonas vaginalis G3]|uniref:Transmembrane protein n=1 Tax=Trichomonas vaginalis (strain ATCC PRA-98 / G3) TaxID=412133 RepID=A2DI54_TRIV3|nr:hypothetical protein TVAGG3_0712610 [Trichomonas vaginalis G3]EAY19850.1 hypothetical protein TVAG_129580 [Trichomonas vaginalis G3]KAI5510021.1 hypothetical protein TVAGG3_0712610 [Trichomonas vaginalis G3]|eukprot:XP_001580836.1 hypothetical protein [Trichomonas vaginalis G3]